MAIIREELWQAETKVSLAEAFDRRQSYEDKVTNVGIESSVYPLVCLSNFLHPDFYSSLKKDISILVKYNRKVNDLYDFSQSGDLMAYRSQVFENLRGSLLDPDALLGLVETITKRRLSRTQLDLSSQMYNHQNYLLAHDDRLDSRRVAFVLYLVDPEWNEFDGGHLEFFPSDWKSEPTLIAGSQKFLPRPNTFVFFEVGMNSHHQVAEVVGNRSRISISGWFHDDEESASLRPIPPSISINVPAFINPGYTVSRTDDQVIVANVLTAQFHMELTTYIAFRRPDAHQVVTTTESFWFYQESEEPLWMKNLLTRQFSDFIAGFLGISIDWPTRPVLKVFSKAGFRSVAAEASQRVFICIGDTISWNDNSIIITQDDIYVPKDSNCSLIEIKYHRVS